MIERTIYQCEYCRSTKRPKKLLSPYEMLYHEKHCFYNPKNKTCFTCIHNCKAKELYRSRVGCNLTGTPFDSLSKEELQNSLLSDLLQRWDCSKYEYDGGNNK